MKKTVFYLLLVLCLSKTASAGYLAFEVSLAESSMFPLSAIPLQCGYSFKENLKERNEYFHPCFTSLYTKYKNREESYPEQGLLSDTWQKSVLSLIKKNEKELWDCSGKVDGVQLLAESEAWEPPFTPLDSQHRDRGRFKAVVP